MWTFWRVECQQHYTPRATPHLVPQQAVVPSMLITHQPHSPITGVDISPSHLSPQPRQSSPSPWSLTYWAGTRSMLGRLGEEAVLVKLPSFQGSLRIRPVQGRAKHCGTWTLQSHFLQIDQN